MVAAGFPVVATTSGGVAATLGYEDHERAPAGEMLAAAARIARSVKAPVTVDAEAGYGTRTGSGPWEAVTSAMFISRDQRSADYRPDMLGEAKRVRTYG